MKPYCRSCILAPIVIISAVYMAGVPNGEANRIPAGAEAFRVGGVLPPPSEVTHWSENEVPQRLSIYGPSALMVDSIYVHGDGSRGIARFRAGGIAVRRILSGKIISDEFGENTEYTVPTADVEGHFAPSSGLREVNPGIRSLALARTIMDRKRTDSRRLSRITGVSFEKIPVKGSKSRVVEVEAVEDQEVEHVEVRVGNNTVAKAGLVYSEDAPVHDPEKHVDPEYMIESAAQAAVLLMQHQKGWPDLGEFLPLFRGIDEVEIRRAIKKDEHVTLDVAFEETPRGFMANATVYNSDVEIAQVITGMRAEVKDKSRLIRVFHRLVAE